MDQIIDFIQTYWLFLVIVGSTILLLVVGFLIYNRFTRVKVLEEEPVDEKKAQKLDEELNDESTSLEEDSSIEDKEDSLSDLEAETEAAKQETESKVEENKTEELKLEKPVKEEPNKVESKEATNPVVVEEPKKQKPAPFIYSFDEPKQEEPDIPSFDRDSESDTDDEDMTNSSNDANETNESNQGTEKKLGKYHVLYNKTMSYWYVKREGSEKVLQILETQQEAIAWATIKSLRQNVGLVVHKKDGKIRKANF